MAGQEHAPGGTPSPSRRRLRWGAAPALVVVALVVTALPAFGHASFPSSQAFGFAPNVEGGSGAPGVAPPYPGGTTQTVYLRAPVEQDAPFEGADDTNVDVTLTVPDGWGDPMCGPAKVQINDDSTSNTNQPGEDVAGWTCEVETAEEQTVLHWSGPQVTPPATKDDSAQFFVFAVTTPRVEVQTTYNGTGGTGAFVAVQTYASGHAKRWVPHEDLIPDPPDEIETVVSGGMARTVAPACTEPVAGPFPDVPTGHPFCADVDWLAGEGITGGFIDGSFRPASPVTRGSMAAFLYRFWGSPTWEAPAASPFSDVPTSHPFYDEITWLADEGITGGFTDGSFRPASPVTRGSMSAFLYRSVGSPAFEAPEEPTFSDVAASHVFFDDVEWLASIEVTGGYEDGSFRPGSSVTRGSMAAFLHRFGSMAG